MRPATNKQEPNAGSSKVRYSPDNDISIMRRTKRSGIPDHKHIFEIKIANQ
jgi:hypothetical protein